MSMPITTNHIELRPDSGDAVRAFVAGTGIRVSDVYRWAEIERRSVRAIVAQHPELSLSEVHAALAYAWDHADQMRAEIRDMAASSQTEVETASPTCLELAERTGFVGSAPEAPTDLSTNPCYLDGFGRGEGTR